MLASNSGVMLAQHFCGEYKMMEKITYGVADLSCGMDVHSDCDSEGAKDHDCCDNEYESLGVDDEFNRLDLNEKQIINTHFVAAFTTIFVLDLSLTANSKTTTYRAYLPPPLIKDIPVLYETFLI
ncbi:hypothetical protein ULMS_09090 [Patiriisocius marinistellae]|uniref:Uncharacterized protein n=1 Tax=Patiriisocius marinistellae TaxID=2494560 RepID=A0A5J4G051_9FLAO|nr:hypothetical protein ULMS_09090 [Patiriisocius marinistellae]